MCVNVAIYFSTEKEIAKKESKRKKKKNVDKEANLDGNKLKLQKLNKGCQDNNDNVLLTELSHNKCTHRSYKSTGNDSS